ncbi:hypothetical protein [Sphingomonas sp. GM_Shp_1]|uniref:hypothetical protein n=1 Tax=Sphingomonas sp. GM_Shp_1 TaxID=2937381 RepID=UPI00226B3C79|nr:hypothetical protein [Sphingomonas sp. GM_Shp_1]
MAAFDDSSDPALGAACNRLAAWVETLPQGVTIDPASDLSEDDLALILRHLHATRHDGAGQRSAAPPPVPRASVPVTAKG